MLLHCQVAAPGVAAKFTDLWSFWLLKINVHWIHTEKIYSVIHNNFIAVEYFNILSFFVCLL